MKVEVEIEIIRATCCMNNNSIKLEKTWSSLQSQLAEKAENNRQFTYIF